MSSNTFGYPVRFRGHLVLLFIGLIVAGVAGNHFPFSILNAHFIFGSIFAMLVLQIFGWGRGVIAAAIISGYTYLTWNHPWAFVAMTGEAVVVGWLFTRRQVSLVTADALYWIILGIPLGLFCFHILSGFPVSSSIFLITKQAYNGIANALVARLIFAGISRPLQAERISLRETLSNLLVLFVLLTSIILVTQNARRDLAQTDRDIRLVLVSNSRNMTDGLQSWLTDREAAVVHLAQLAATLSPSEMQARLEQADASDGGFLRIVFVDREGIAVAYSPTVDELGRPTAGKSFADRPYFPLLRQSLKPMLSEVMPSHFSRTGSVVILLAPVLADGVYSGAVGGIMDFNRIGKILETHVFGREFQYTLVDKNGNVILTNCKDQEVMKPFFMGGGSFEPITGLHSKSLPPETRSKASPGDAEEKIRQWIPQLPPGASTIDLWGKSKYVIESNLGHLSEWKLILEQPVAPFQKRLYSEYSGKFSLLFAILLISLVVAAWVSRRAVAGIEGLGVITRDLPPRLESGEQIAWSDSAIQEIRVLKDNIRDMADSLRERFLEIRRLNESLEQRVKERTRELQESNRKLLASQAETLTILKDLKTENETRKAREAELRQVSMAIEQAGEVVIITDPDGSIQYVNPAFTAVTGYSREEAVGQKPRILKSGRQDEAFYRHLWETITNGEVWKGRMVNKHKDGTLYAEEATISPVLGDAGRVVNFVAVKRDVTEREQAETEKEKLQAQLMQAQKMESVGRLAGGVAHDFNNKLTVMMGYAQMAMNDLEKTDPLYGNLQEVLKAGKQSVDIVRQLLAFARKQIIAPEVLDLNETMEGMLKMLRRLIGEDIDLLWQPDTNLWNVKMDPSQIDQILANLCVNARDAIQDAGKVTIETRNTILNEAYCAEHAGAVPGEYVMLAVSDAGYGMDRETLENIFEPFFTTKDREKGTGLGLATVYGIVKQNNGFIDVESEPGRGTAFRIYLPRHGEEVEEKVEAVEAEIPQGRGETILIVEDDAPVLQLAQRVLENLGYAVLTSASPAAALAMTREYQGEIHLLMTDVVLPEMSGKEVAREISKIRPAIRTLYMSGYTTDVIAHHGVLDEGVQFIGKPFMPDILAWKVREAIDSEK